MQVAGEGELDEPRGDLRRPEQRADRDHGAGIEAGALEDRQQMRRERRRHEGVGREGRRDQQERGARCGRAGAGGVPAARGWIVADGARARQREGMQRRGDAARAAPA